MSLHFLGIRHHGPGCAHSVAAALAQLQPDCVLIEGPPEADALIPWAEHADMHPPVALLVYMPQEPQQAVFYPFARFSPEWQALQHALRARVAVRFIDLPQALRMTSSAPTVTQAEPEPKELPDPGTDDEGTDPLAALALAAGYGDADTWWEHLIEERRDSLDLFAAIAELMQAARQDDAGQWLPPENLKEARREAHMRQMVREAVKQGFDRIAVVCGAWHVPALAREDIKARDDAALLKGLPRVKTAATWVPWSFGRLTFASGYGAGIQAPGWYEHLWQHHANAAMHWLMDAARHLRKNDLDASSAHVIEAVRLADSLAALRERPRAGLSELTEALRAVFCGDSEAPLQLIERDLLVAERLGRVPGDMPMLPLPQDVQQQQKRLRLAVRADQTTLDLDLREAAHLEKSIFLHRLALLGMEWGKAQTVRGKSGTFHELWTLAWEPEFSIRLIEANIWGGTVLLAAGNYALHRAKAAHDLPQLTALVNQVLLADVRHCVPGVMAALDQMAARTSDLALMLGALPPLAHVLRYGNVRGTDAGALTQVVHSLSTRAAIALLPGTQGLNDEAAAALLPALNAADQALRLIQIEPLIHAWNQATHGVALASGSHPLLAGRAGRILLDQGVWQAEEAAQRLALVCSNPHASQGAALGAAQWIEGFLQGSGALLVHQDSLFHIVDHWLGQLPADLFQELLPLLRRTFSGFQPAEKQRIYARAQPGAATTSPVATGVVAHFRPDQAAPLLPTLYRLFGLTPPVQPAPQDLA